MPRACYRLYTVFGVDHIGQAVFLLERAQTDRQAQLKALPTPAAIISVDNNAKSPAYKFTKHYHKCSDPDRLELSRINAEQRVQSDHWRHTHSRTPTRVLVQRQYS